MIVLVSFTLNVVFIQRYDPNGHEIASDKMFDIRNNDDNDQRRRQLENLFAISLPFLCAFCW